MAHCRPPITPKASILAITVASRRSPLDPMREPEAYLPAALVTPPETFVNVFADPTTKKETWEFCGRNVTLLPCLAKTKPGPDAATLGLAVPNQIRRHATSPKDAHRKNTLNLRLI
jgi:hypothetical protein